MGIGLLITGAAVLIAVILLFAVLGKAASKGKRQSYTHGDAGGSGVWIFDSTNGDHSSGSDSGGSSDGGGGGGGSD